MIPRDKVIALLRAEEATSLKMLPEPEPGTRHAQSIAPITRLLYAAIERPPTRHRVFFIRTRWRRDGWVAEYHGVFVKERPWKFRQVVDDRPGVFGA